MQFETLEQAAAALDGCKDTLFNGRRLTVEYVAPNAPRPPPKDRVRDPYGPPMRHDPCDGYAPYSRSPMREDAPRHVERPAMSMRRGFERDAEFAYAPAGRLERSRGPPMYRAYGRDEPPPRRFMEVRYEPQVYERPRAPLVRRAETYVRGKGAHCEEPAQRYNPAERYDGRPAPRYAHRRENEPFGVHPRGRYASVSPDAMRSSPGPSPEARRVSPAAGVGRNRDDYD
jgi:hypothetical protein